MCFWVVNSSLSIDEYWFRATAVVLRNWVNNYFLAVEPGGEAGSKSLPLNTMITFVKLPLALLCFY